MVSTRPRRAARAPLTVRVARFAVPGLLLGLATTGVVAAATHPAEESAAVPTVTAAASSPAAVVGERPAAVSRGQSAVRPSLSPAALAEAAAKAARVQQHAEAAAKAKAKAQAAARAKAKAARDKAAAAKAARLRAERREAAEKKALAAALHDLSTRYTRVDLNVRAAADPGSTLLTVLKTRAELSVTPVVRDGWRYVSYRGRGAWVKNQYLVTKRPKAPAAAAAAGSGISSSACKSGSAVESGLTPDAVRVHRAICARYPAVKAYGGVRADSLPEHPSGRALDAMVSSTATGWEIARWVRANAKQLGVSEVLFAQHIWTVQRGGEGWRTFPDRGSVSANHFDHVHVTVYGSSGG